MELIEVILVIIGYSYTIFWSLSFYGQVYENYMLKSVKGLSFDYQIFNLSGFTTYTIYNLWVYFDDGIEIDVGMNDVLFAVHALVLTIVTVFQIYALYINPQDPVQRVTMYGWFVTALIWWGIATIFLVEQVLKLYDYQTVFKEKKFNMLVYMSFVKVFISFIKYLPQLIYNFRRKSTKGWSIFNIILDFLGGLFSFLEIIINVFLGKYKVDDGEGNSSLNYAKFTLSIVAMFFDILFLIQHYILYYDKEPEEIGEGADFYTKVNDEKNTL